MSLLTRFGRSIQRFKRDHALAVAASVAVLAGGVSAVALAIVAPLAPDPADLPQRIVDVPVMPSSVEPQLEALAAQPLELSRAFVLRGPDALGAVLRRAGVLDARALAQLQDDALVREAMAHRGMRLVDLRLTPQGQLVQFRARLPVADEARQTQEFVRITARAVEGRWFAVSETVPLGADMKFASGTIRSSLYAATDDAGIPDALATQLAEIFSGDIDFHKQLRKGDTFSLVYEALTADGEAVPWAGGTGRVLAAEFLNAGKVHQAIWFDPESDGKGDYFDLQGRSRKRTFLASPMEFSRVTSGFAMRLHPIFRDLRQHRGVDYGAPEGTPVRTVGDGVVEFAGRQGGYGNVVEVRHSKERSTLYAHLSRIDVKPGQKLRQGDRLGAVGATGWATGPHLHFEFRIAGEHQDPAIIARQADPGLLDETTQRYFGGVAQAMKVRLDIAHRMSTDVAAIRFE